MDDESLAHSARAKIAALQRDRALLAQQIKESQETIERSRELLRRIDEMLARAGEKQSD